MKMKNNLMSLEEQVGFSNKLNEHYCRFERVDLDSDLDQMILQLQEKMKEDRNDQSFETNPNTVKKLFLNINARKAMGPDGISGRLLKACASQLSDVFCTIFNDSLRDCSIPHTWKKSLICPVPKKKNPSNLNDFRPVALTSIIMKCFEKIVLSHLLTFTSVHMDQFQFAYKPNRSIDDAILTLIHNALFHLNGQGSFVRILFIDFSSAFNTIQPHLLAEKLSNLNVNPKITLWILNFLLNRTQCVRFNSGISDQRSTSTGAPQGTVLAPVLFTLYTNDCRGTDTTPVVKYSDDSAILDLSNSDDVYFNEVHNFSSWCKDNYLDLNVLKTKEMLIDFRRNAPSVPSLFINKQLVERVDEYKYLGTILDKKLTFDKHVENIHKRCQPRIFCLQKLRNIGINKMILNSYYQCCVESLLTVSFIGWYGSLSVRSKKVLNDVVNVSSKIVGMKQKGLQELYERRVRKVAKQIACDDGHVLAKYFELLPSGRRFRTMKGKLRSLKTFVPNAIHLLNS